MSFNHKSKYSDYDIRFKIAEYKLYQRHEKILLTNDDRDTCWICHDEVFYRRVMTVPLGCACKTCAHLSCAARWFLPKITFVASGAIFNTSLHYTFSCTCTTCNKKIHTCVTNLFVASLANDKPNVIEAASRIDRIDHQLYPVYGKRRTTSIMTRILFFIKSLLVQNKNGNR